MFTFLRYLWHYLLLDVLGALVPHPKLRAVYLRLLGARIGNNVRIDRVSFVQLQYSVRNLHCADNTFIGSGVLLDLSAPIILDKYAIIGPGCSILTHQDFGDFNGNPVSAIYKTKEASVHLAEGAVIGADTTVLAGATIGAYSVIAAKSLIKGAVPSGVLAAGIPAKVVRDHSAQCPPRKEQV